MTRVAKGNTNRCAERSCGQNLGAENNYIWPLNLGGVRLSFI
jgi:hypothetical protein